jgi:hypothetical protein
VYDRGSIQREIVQQFAVWSNPFDVKRREFLKQLGELTQRNVVLYAMKPQTGIWTDDVQGFMAAQHELKGDQLDLIIHSPGGSGDAAEQIINYLRQKYSHIRVIVPLYAMSAATMIACAADEIIMGKESALGPIDPQFQTAAGSMPAHAIKEEFEFALKSVKEEPKTAAFWVPKLSTVEHGYYSLALTEIRRSITLVRDWLERHMKLNAADADRIATWLGSDRHGSHGKPISFPEANAVGLKVTALEADQNFQNLVLAVFHTTMLTFDGTPCFKMVENHNGRGFYQNALAGAGQTQQVQPSARPVM